MDDHSTLLAQGECPLRWKYVDLIHEVLSQAPGRIAERREANAVLREVIAELGQAEKRSLWARRKTRASRRSRLHWRKILVHCRP